MRKNLRWTVLLALVSASAFAAGCSGEGGTDDGADGGPAAVSEADDHADGQDAGAHGEWWCAEHGVPEEECTRCDSSLIAGFKDKGDWCQEHDLPESQCFKCDPKRAEPFIARYEAKYGKKPPAPVE